MLLYREVNPGMLHRTERGKAASIAMAQGKEAERYGVDRREVHGIQGLELLEQHLKERDDEAADDDAQWDGWEVESDDESDMSGGWVNVSSDDEQDYCELEKRDDDEDEKEEEKASLLGRRGWKIYRCTSKGQGMIPSLIRKMPKLTLTW